RPRARRWSLSRRVEAAHHLDEGLDFFRPVKLPERGHRALPVGDDLGELGVAARALKARIGEVLWLLAAERDEAALAVEPVTARAGAVVEVAGFLELRGRCLLLVAPGEPHEARRNQQRAEPRA